MTLKIDRDIGRYNMVHEQDTPGECLHCSSCSFFVLWYFLWVA